MFHDYYHRLLGNPKLMNDVIKRVRVPLPATKEEQGAIASVLSAMDAEIDELEKKLEKARQIKRGMMQELLTGRIRLI
jgi:type I restriction enzyme S subunit